jgi:hypothetical protein
MVAASWILLHSNGVFGSLEPPDFDIRIGMGDNTVWHAMAFRSVLVTSKNEALFTLCYVCICNVNPSEPGRTV